MRSQVQVQGSGLYVPSASRPKLRAALHTRVVELNVTAEGCG